MYTHIYTYTHVHMYTCTHIHTCYVVWFMYLLVIAYVNIQLCLVSACAACYRGSLLIENPVTSKQESGTVLNWSGGH